MTPVSPLRAIKVGGSLAGITGALPRAGQVLAQAAARQPTVVLPGGGPFADAVRAFDQSHGLSDDAAHWMAILAMDQYAHVLADHVPGSRLVRSLPQIRAAHEAGAVPILAPARWLRRMDDLPHTWEVTSDSLAAYLATLIGAEELVLIKAVRGGMELVDPHFPRALAAGMRYSILAFEDIEGLTTG
ncbi:MAG: hypothetical protein OEW17_00580 [Gemmatimonadota bacterium]|nr:hypothetical protein [Gemmatimonadota bacterium]MDH5283447.1 hypothetical protein [Gemmatimonadota bacterium]